MEQTVVGVFDSLSDAQAAVTALAATGLSRERVQLSEAQSASTQATEGHSHPQEEGVLSSIKHFFSGLFGDDAEHQTAPYAEAVRRGGAVVRVNVVGEDELERVTDALDDAGAVDIEERVETWRSQGWRAGTQPLEATGTNVPSAATSREVAFEPTVNQSLLGGKRVGSDGTLRVFDRHVEAGSSGLGADADYERHAEGYRRDFQDHYGLTSSYAEYEPAYRFGHNLKTDDRYRGRHWEDIEPDVRTDWEETNHGSAWDRFKGAIRHAWDKATD